MTKDTNTTSGPAIKRYKIGYHTDEWGVRSSTPGGITDPSGQWVLYKDHLAALASHRQAPAQAAPVLEDAARLKEAVWLLEELAVHDNYSTEYDGRVLYICPECGEQDGEHRAACAFVRAKAFLAARKQGANHD